MRNTSYFGALLLGGAFTLTGGCAMFGQGTSEEMPAAPMTSSETQQALDESRAAVAEAQAARRIAEQALRAAQDAQAMAGSASGAANSCEARCTEVESKIERAFQQSLTK